MIPTTPPISKTSQSMNHHLHEPLQAPEVSIVIIIIIARTVAELPLSKILAADIAWRLQNLNQYLRGRRRQLNGSLILAKNIFAG